MVFEHFLIFSSNQNFFCIIIFNYQILKIYTRSSQLTKLTNTEKGRIRLGTKLSENLTRKEKNNDAVDGTENHSESRKQLDNHQHSNKASLNKTILEGKFVSKNVINLSRRNLCRP